MKNHYYYLIASLPRLEFGMKMSFSYRDFIVFCEEQLTSKDMAIIKRADISPCEDTKDQSSTLREWKGFDRDLRNELARLRAIKHSKDPSKYVRGEYYPDPFKAGFAQWILSLGSPLEAELAISKFKWQRLEELKKGHYFDIDYLIIYALKLKILERWDMINREEGKNTLKDMVEISG